ncbi:MAG: hypothetical protein U0871_01435 [Gemmataceae bacterium]
MNSTDDPIADAVDRGEIFLLRLLLASPRLVRHVGDPPIRSRTIRRVLEVMRAVERDGVNTDLEQVEDAFAADPALVAELHRQRAVGRRLPSRKWMLKEVLRHLADARAAQARRAIAEEHGG